MTTKDGAATYVTKNWDEMVKQWLNVST